MAAFHSVVSGFLARALLVDGRGPQGAYVALKQVTISDSSRSQREVEALEHEIALLKTLQHPNIVQYYGTRRARRKLYIILEFCSGGSVASALKQFGIFSEVGGISNCAFA